MLSVSVTCFVASLMLGLSPTVPWEPDGGRAFRPAELRCEYAESPLGLDVRQPRLSWTLACGREGARQTAYRIVVASSESFLDEDILWDTGKVESARQNQIVYEGKPLSSHQVCYWKVRAWDEAGEPGPWAEGGRWSMGLLDEADWGADWISPGDRGKHSVDDCSWMWYPEATPGPCVRGFRMTFDLPPALKEAPANFYLSGDNIYTLYVNGREAGGSAVWNAFQRLDISDLLEPGRNALAIHVENGGDGPNPAGVIGVLEVGGMRIPIDETWKAGKVLPEGWKLTGFDDEDWPRARVLGPSDMEPWGKPRVARALPVLRKAFTSDKPLRRATLYACGLGFHEWRVNGALVTEDRFEPGWTDYHDTCLYRAYDVTGHMTSGENVLGVMLGNGFYNVEPGRYTKYLGSFGPLKLICHLRIEYEDGTVNTVVSDGSWRGTDGPIVFSSIYGGEDYDARRALAGWDRPGFEDDSWTPATVAEGPGGRLCWNEGPPIRERGRWNGVLMGEPKPGVYVYDLKQNLSGIPSLKVRGPRGAKVTLTPGELLDDQGLVTQRSSGGPMWYSYVLKGGEVETWAPRFSYYGFRYVQVEGAVPKGQAEAGQAEVLGLEGLFTTAARQVGQITCKETVVKDIPRLIEMAIRSNFQSVLTDCPHREKLGWLEVSHLLADGISYNYDTAGFYTKIQRDMRDSQTPEGLVPDIAPEYTVFSGGFRDSPEWGSACVVNPWHVYKMYGDTRVFTEHYDVMVDYVDYLASKAEGHIVSHGLGDWYDIGPGNPGVSQLTSPGVTATAVYYQDLTILAKVAALLGKDADARGFTRRAEDVRRAFNAKFYRPEAHCYDRNSQTANAMALTLGLVEEDHRAAVLDTLVRSIAENGYRVTAGDVGFSYLVRALTESGQGETLYRMVRQTEGPGYAYQLARGATTLTEAWDANPHSSHNHCMLGHAENWFYQGLAGIQVDPDAPGFQHFILRPEIYPELGGAVGEYHAITGRIYSDWSASGEGLLQWRIVIPANTSATAYIPRRGGKVTRQDRPGMPEVIEETTDYVKVELPAGAYTFISEGW